MGLRSTVNKAVRTAFRAIGDLKTSATLYVSNKSFDFASGTVTEKDQGTIKLEGVLMDEKRREKVVKIFLCVKIDLELSDAYDRLTTGGKTYRLTAPIKSDDFLTYIEVAEVHDGES